MKTPTKYSKLVKRNELTEEMIGHVAFSINKRAKNYRDKRNEYRCSNYRHAYSCMQSYEGKMNEAYIMKEHLLNLYQPIELHKTVYKNAYFKKIFSDQPDYEEIKQKDIISRGYSYTTGNPYKEVLIEKCKEQYYLYFIIAGFKFHQPIDEDRIENYKGLFIKTLKDNFKVEGKKGTEILSAQFCKKVYQLIQSEEYTLTA